MARELVHGTCVALGQRAALLRGESGAGKSDLALRFLALPGEGDLHPNLVADDQVFIDLEDGQAIASAPETLAGLIEVRGLGIAEMPYVAAAPLVLVCNLVANDAVPRMPPEPWNRVELAGGSIPALKLSAFEDSAPLKLRMALLQAPEQRGLRTSVRACARSRARQR
ncbi:MAG: HPr kinase/phosphorylase [Alphaproteobacteria bacterium]